MAGQASYNPSFWWFGYGQPEDLPLMKQLGLDGVGFTAGSREGEGMKYYFDSPTLRGCDWAQRSSERENLTEYAARAHAAGLKVMANLEGVSPGHSEAGKKYWTPELASGIMRDVRRDGADRWFTEDVVGWPDIFIALADTGREIGLEYQEGDDPGYVHYSHPETGLGFVDLYRRGHMVSLYHYQYRRDELGKSASLAEEASLGYAFARSWGLPTVMVFTVGHDWGERPEYWEGILRPSIAIRALQFRLDEFDLIGLDDAKARQVDIASTKQWVAALVAQNAQERRPLLNLVAQLRPGREGHWDDLAGSGDAITCGAFHAGWNVVASTEPHPDADAYYVYTTGRDAQGTLDLPPQTAALFAGEKPVFLQIGAVLPSGSDLTANWRKALEACGLDPAGAWDDGDLPKTGMYKGASFRYTGVLVAYLVRERTHGTRLPRAAVTGVLSAEGDGLALIVSKGNKHLLPANCVSWQMMGPISDLLSGCGVRSSSDVWGIAGEKVTVLLATHDTDLDLVIPRLAKGAKITVTQWDKHHQITHFETVTYTGAFHRAMMQFDSILIEAQ